MKFTELQVGDLVFTRPKDLIGRLVSKVQRMGYSHCGFITRDGYGITEFNEAEIIPGVHASRIDERLNGQEVYIVRPKFDFHRNSFSSAAFSKVGCKYDRVGIFHQLIKEWTGKWLDKKASNDHNSFYCSKYYAYCITRACKNALFVDYNKISLNDLYNNKNFDFVFKGVLIN